MCICTKVFMWHLNYFLLFNSDITGCHVINLYCRLSPLHFLFFPVFLFITATTVSCSMIQVTYMTEACQYRFSQVSRPLSGPHIPDTQINWVIAVQCFICNNTIKTTIQSDQYFHFSHLMEQRAEGWTGAPICPMLILGGRPDLQSQVSSVQSAYAVVPLELDITTWNCIIVGFTQ